MARTESTHRAKRTADSSQTDDRSTDDSGHPNRFRTCVCLAGLVLACSACGLASSGPGLGFKIGAQTLEDPIDLDKTTRARFELEFSTARFYDDHFDMAFTVGGSSLGSFTTDYADVVDGALIEETYVDDLSLIDIRLAARFYPLGNASEVRPYVGAGLGYFWFLDRWDYDYAETFEDPFYPGDYYTILDHDEGIDTAASGLFPFITAGLTLPIGDHGELVFDFQYDFDKEDSGFDLGGPIYMIGGRFRF